MRQTTWTPVYFIAQLFYFISHVWPALRRYGELVVFRVLLLPLLGHQEQRTVVWYSVISSVSWSLKQGRI